MTRTPPGELIVRKHKNDIEQNKIIRNDILSLFNNDGRKPNQILILIHSKVKESCLKEMRKIGSYEIISAYKPVEVKLNNVM